MLFKTYYDLVEEFHKAFGVDIEGKMNLERLLLRERLVDEEYDEVKAEMSKSPSSPEFSEEKILKELCDLLYVIYGTAVTFGWDIDEAFERVHYSNMSKLGNDGNPVYRSDGKVIKGPNYQPPDLSDLV